jgi:hypothetical protein
LVCQAKKWPLQSGKIALHGPLSGDGNEAHRFAASGETPGVQAGIEKRILTRKEKEHIKFKTKQIVTSAGLFEN